MPRGDGPLALHPLRGVAGPAATLAPRPAIIGHDAVGQPEPLRPGVHRGLAAAEASGNRVDRDKWPRQPESPEAVRVAACMAPHQATAFRFASSAAA
jgi:hypothetical protein